MPGVGGVGLAFVPRSPDLVEEVPLADELAGVADQDLQQMPFGGGKAYVAALWVVTVRLARSTTCCPIRTVGGLVSVGVVRRVTARMRASSSSMLNGLVT
jgi:hypothetical protein